MMCGHCGSLLGDSPSDYFCSEYCQMWWWEQSGRTDPELMALARQLDEQAAAMLGRQYFGNRAALTQRRK